MPQSFACLHYHLVISTKDRLPVIKPDYCQSLFDYIGGIIRAQKGIILGANGTADHSHLLATFHREIAGSAMLRMIKDRIQGFRSGSTPGYNCRPVQGWLWSILGVKQKSI